MTFDELNRKLGGYEIACDWKVAKGGARTIIAKLAANAGVPSELITASLSITAKP